MSSDNNEDWLDEGDVGENELRGSRGRVRDAAPDDREQVSVSKELMADGAERTEVSHPRRPLKTPGQIKQAYESGGIDLDVMIRNAQEGLSAMKEIVVTDSEGSGKDRVTTQRIEYVPDHPMRLRWQEYLTNVVEGMPVKRQEIISRHVTTQEELEKMLKKSKAARKSMWALLEKMELEAEKELSKKGGAES